MGNSESEAPVGARAGRWEKACDEAMRSCVAEGGGFASVDDALAYNYISIYVDDPEIADAVLAASDGARLPEAVRATALSHALSDLDSWDACEFRERAIAYAGGGQDGIGECEERAQPAASASTDARAEPPVTFADLLDSYAELAEVKSEWAVEAGEIDPVEAEAVDRRAHRLAAQAEQAAGTALDGLPIEQVFDMARRCAEGGVAGPSSGPGRGRGRAM